MSAFSALFALKLLFFQLGIEQAGLQRLDGSERIRQLIIALFDRIIQLAAGNLAWL